MTAAELQLITKLSILFCIKLEINRNFELIIIIIIIIIIITTTTTTTIIILTIIIIIMITTTITTTTIIIINQQPLFNTLCLKLKKWLLPSPTVTHPTPSVLHPKFQLFCSLLCCE